MIHRTYEGGALSSGLNIVSMSDKGFVLCLRIGMRFWSFRRRGPNNTVKPRHYFQAN